MPAQLTVDTAPPSAVFIYTSHSGDNLKPPLSPTSSIKGCFVRSRPTSTDFEFEYSKLPNFAMEPSVSSEGSVTTTRTTSVSDDLERASLATEQWALAQMAKDSDARSLAPSTLTCTDRRPVVPVRIIRRSDADMDKEVAKMAKEKRQLKEQNASEDALRARRRTWPSYKAIRKTMSNILHRKDAPATATTAAKEAKGELPGLEPTVGRAKSSSASMFTKRRRATVSDGEKKTDAKAHAPVMHRAASSRGKTANGPLQHISQLRRSRSFSGFTNVLTVIDDADDDLDELTTEARGVVLDIRRRWDFEEVPEDAAMMFERCIE
ncbi:hypothetical protein BDZ94DRAFT_1308308 [Collybia nuda]|uniref:Uncharacterized protein n=1 Tax=Collybia nuda TaxID=64659 RepID=A0A9P5Y864_9AGAR|nr:hypothetical protein BDZ94DRAFT_1308308 [Collybia nuda]